MSQAQFTLPLIVQSAGNIIYASEWNAEFSNIAANLNPAGIGGLQDSLAQKQLQEDPATGLAASLQKDIEQLRFALKRAIGETYWYDTPDSDIATLDKQTYAILTCGAAGAVTVSGASNVASASYSADVMTVTFTTAFATANYAPQLTGDAVTSVTNSVTVGARVKTGGKATGTLEITAFKRDGTTVNFASGDIIYLHIPNPHS